MITIPRQPVGAGTRRNKRLNRRARGHLSASGLTYTNASAGSLLDVTFDALPGTMTHVVGSSTADSATLLGLLVGLYPPDGGVLTLDGKDVADIPPASSRSSVVLVLQDPWIMSGTVADNIAFGDPGADRTEMETVASLACLDEFIADLPEGMETPLGSDDRVAPTIGHRRLIALARALLRDPAVLLIEDPFRDLTTREETLMIKAVNEAGRDRTTIVTTQRFDPAMFSTDQVLLLEGGQLQAVPPSGDRVPLPGLPPHPDPTAPPPKPRTPLPAPSSPTEGVKSDSGARWDGGLRAGSDLGHGYRAASLLHRDDLIDTWLAWHGNSTTIVEAKVARNAAVAEAARPQLSAEYERARRLQHPGIARPVAAHLSSARPFIVYERVGGTSLTQLIGSAPTDDGPSVDVAAIGAALARTLAFVHRLGFAHLGLVPDVVMVTNPGATITDLRYAAPVGTRQDRTIAVHERGVIAPEQLSGGAAAPPMDLYALGCVLFQTATGVLLTGEAGPDVSDIDAHLPPPIADVVASMLAPDPEQRPNAAEVLGRLRPLVVPIEPRHPARSGQLIRVGNIPR
jgi:ABC-type thiamine transport system ATPase subunit